MTDFPISAGELRTLVTFQKPTITQGADGAQIESWANVATNPTVKARWVNDHGDELIQSEALQSKQRATVTVRHRTDLGSGYRVLKGSEVWEILSPPDGVQDRNRWIALRVQRAKGSL